MPKRVQMLTRLKRLGALCGIFLASAALLSCGLGKPERPDVLFVIIDALRAENLPFHGYDRPTAPYMTELANQGAVFENFNCNGLWTRASVPSILTGQFIHTHGLTLGDLSENTKHVDRLASEKYTLLEMAQGLGYRTGGYFVPGWYGEDFGFNQGFDDEIGMEEYKEFWFSRETLNLGNKGLDIRATDKYITERAAKWITDPPANEKKKPFFAYIHVNGAHGPFDTPEPEGTAFLDKAAVDAMRARFADTYKIEADLLNRQDPDGAVQKYLVSQYDSAILYTDKLIKSLHETASKRSRNLLVVITSDHGQAMNERPFEYRHGSSVLPYHELTHIPFVMHWPKRIPALRVPTRAQSVDIVPTLMRAMNGALPQQPVDGVDLLPLLDVKRWPGNPPPADRLLVMEGDENFASVAVVEKNLKYIGVAPTSENSFWLGSRLPAGFEALYDLAADERETKDLSSANPDAVNHLRRRADRECWLPMPGYHLVIVGDASKPMGWINAQVDADSELDRATIRYHNDNSPLDIHTTMMRTLRVSAVKGRAGLTPANVQVSGRPKAATPGTILPFYGPRSPGRGLKLLPTPVELTVNMPPYTSTDRELIIFGGWFKKSSGEGLPKLRLVSKQGNLYGECAPEAIAKDGAWIWSYALVGKGLNEFVLALHSDAADGPVYQIRNLFVAPARATFSGLKRESNSLKAAFPITEGRVDLRFLTVEDPGSLNLSLSRTEVGSATETLPLRIWTGKDFAPATASTITAADLAAARVPREQVSKLTFAEPGTAYFFSTAVKSEKGGSISRDTTETLKTIGYLGGDKEPAPPTPTPTVTATPVR